MQRRSNAGIFMMRGTKVGLSLRPDRALALERWGRSEATFASSIESCVQGG